MRRLRLALAVAAFSALVLSSSAVAKEYAPPGKAGTSEYAEDIPSAGGNVLTPATGGANKTAAQINHLGDGKTGVRRLAKLGKTGAAAALWAQQTAPAVSKPAARSTGSKSKGSKPATGSHGAGGDSYAVLTAQGGSALSGVAHLLGGTDSGGIGAVFPLLLALCAVSAVVFGAVRLRRPRSDS